MPERLKKRATRVVGARQVMRALNADRVGKVFLALDAAPHLRGQIEQAAQAAGVPIELVATMEELAQLCRVDVPSAAAGVLRNEADNPADTLKADEFAR